MPPYKNKIMCALIFRLRCTASLGMGQLEGMGRKQDFVPGGGKQERQGWIAGSTKEGKKEETKLWKVKKQA